MPYDHDLLIIQVDLFLFIMAQRHKQLFNVERLTAMKIFFPEAVPVLHPCRTCDARRAPKTTKIRLVKNHHNDNNNILE